MDTTEQLSHPHPHTEILKLGNTNIVHRTKFGNYLVIIHQIIGKATKAREFKALVHCKLVRICYLFNELHDCTVALLNKRNWDTVNKPE